MKSEEIKLNDVFQFHYNENEKPKMFDPSHCFDGILVAKNDCDGNLFLQDTYWSDSSSRSFTIEEAEKRGILQFLCNLEDVEVIKEHETDYYAEEDYVYLGIHKGHRAKYFLKKGATRSIAKMKEVVLHKIEKEESKIRSANWAIERLNEALAKIEAGETMVYL